MSKPSKRKLENPIPILDMDMNMDMKDKFKPLLTVMTYSDQLQKDKVKLFEFDKEFVSYFKAPRVMYHTVNEIGRCSDVLIHISADKAFHLEHEFTKVCYKSKEKDGRHTIDLDKGFPYICALQLGRFKVTNAQDDEDVHLEHTWEWYYRKERGKLAEMHKKFIQTYSPKDEVDEILAKLQELAL